jgi:hypothetical protein
VTLIEASRLGHTVAQAAASMLAQKSVGAPRLSELVLLLDDALFADLADAIGPLVSAIEQSAAAQADALQLMEAVQPLVGVYRYGNVRGTDVAMVSKILGTLVPRVFIGLVPAATNIDDDAAGELWKRMSGVQQSLLTLANDSFTDDWRDCLSRLIESATTHSLLAGYACRLLYDERVMEFEDLARRLCLALSTGNPPEHGARWVEGLLSGSGTLLIHDDRLRSILDAWLRSASEVHFLEVLPLLRRSFSKFPAPERRVLGQSFRQKDRGAAAGGTTHGGEFDEAAARALVPILSLIWGKESKP